MIIVKLIGGLGNQMFQYAVGRQLALMKKTSLWLDLKWFPTELITPREFHLKNFKIAAKCVPSWLSEHLLNGRVFEILQKRKALTRILEQGCGLNAQVFDCPSICYLEGYWQTEKYFSSIAPIIRDDFCLRANLSAHRQKILKQLMDRVSVSLHVRRGDYVTNPKTNAYHGTCSAEWYERAMKMMKDQLGDIRFVVFSDDILWAKANLPSHPDTIFVEPDADRRDFEDLHLMASCQHHIIANSSFSWWGAWLNPNPSKKVIAPARWFLVDTDLKDRIPSSWIRL